MLGGGNRQMLAAGRRRGSDISNDDVVEFASRPLIQDAASTASTPYPGATAIGGRVLRYLGCGAQRPGYVGTRYLRPVAEVAADDLLRGKLAVEVG